MTTLWGLNVVTKRLTPHKLGGVVDTVPPSYVQYDRNLSNAKPEEKESIKLLMRNRHTTDKKEEQGHRETSLALGKRPRSVWSKYD
jgi:hypothetical protein